MYGELRGNIQSNTHHPGKRGGKVTGAFPEGGVTESRHLSQEEFLNQVWKEGLSWLKRVTDFRACAITNPKKSDTRVLKT